MAKKIFYFSLSFLILVLIFLGAYNFAFKNNINDPVADPDKKSEEKDENDKFVLADSVENVLNESVLGAVLGSDQTLYYYSFDDQSLKKATSEGKNKTVLMSNLPGEATRILWSAKKDKVLLLLKQSGGGTLWYSANLGNKSLTPLKGEISRLAWDNLGEKLFYQYTDPATKKRTLNMAAHDGSDWKKLADIGASDFFLSSVPQSSTVSFWPRPDANQATAVEIINTSGEERRALFAPLFGGDALWSPNGESLLVSGSDGVAGQGFSLRVWSEKSGALKNLGIPTLISKTTWSRDNRTLFYALPGALPEGAVLPNDYFGKPLYTKDTFWKVDIATGKKTRLLELKESTETLDSSDLSLSENEEYLYFTDRVSKRLYRIEL